MRHDRDRNAMMALPAALGAQADSSPGAPVPGPGPGQLPARLPPTRAGCARWSGRCASCQRRRSRDARRLGSSSTRAGSGDTVFKWGPDPGAAADPATNLKSASCCRCGTARSRSRPALAPTPTRSRSRSACCTALLSTSTPSTDGGSTRTLVRLLARNASFGPSFEPGAVGGRARGGAAAPPGNRREIRGVTRCLVLWCGHASPDDEWRRVEELPPSPALPGEGCRVRCEPLGPPRARRRSCIRRYSLPLLQ